MQLTPHLYNYHIISEYAQFTTENLIRHCSLFFIKYSETNPNIGLLVKNEIENVYKIIADGKIEELLILEWQQIEYGGELFNWEVPCIVTQGGIYKINPNEIKEFNQAFLKSTSILRLFKLLKTSSSQENFLDFINSYCFVFIFRGYIKFLNNFLEDESINVNAYEEVETFNQIVSSEDMNALNEKLKSFNFKKGKYVPSNEPELIIIRGNLEYQEKIIRIIYDRLNKVLFTCDWQDFERHFKKTLVEYKPIKWIGSQPQIVALFEGIPLNNINLFKLIGLHFFDSKNNKAYSNKQLSVVSQKNLNKKIPIISELLLEINKVNSNSSK